MKYKIIIYFSLMILIFSCGTLKTSKKNYYWMPKDFIASKNILLIQESLFPQYAKPMSSCIIKNYHYPFRIINMYDISPKHPEYNDTNKFRFVLIPIHTSDNNNNTPKNYHIKTIDFYIYDRKLDIKYPPTDIVTNNVDEVLKPFLQKLASTK